MRISRLAFAALLLAALVGGVALGRAPISGRPDASPAAPAPSVAASPQAIVLPAADVPGEEIAGLPRYPGSLRIFFDRDDVGDRGVASAEYLVRAPLDDVRSFYRGVFDAGGWTVADMSFAYGEWTFLLVDANGAEAMVELEERSGVIEIDLRLEAARAAADPTAAPTVPAPTAIPVPPAPQPPVQQPAPPPPPPPGDDDGDDDDADDDDEVDDD